VSPSTSPTAIVTDSAADIPAGVAEAHSIRVIPAILVVDGQSLPDGQGLCRETFYARMPSMLQPPTTASPSPEAFAAAYQAALQKGAAHVLSIHVSGRLSGIAQIAQRAARAFDGRVQVVDSGQVSLGAGFQVLAAARAATEGRPLAEVLSAAESVRRRVRVVAMIDDLEYLRRSGRVGWLRSGLGVLLRIRVLIDLADGAVRRLGQVRSRAKAIEALAEKALSWGELDQLGVLHASAIQDAKNLAARLAGRVAHQPLVVDVTTVIGAHVGPRSLGLVGVLAEPESTSGSRPT
jgi:DegV family protein with EDD domain